ncbi:hypothetical protein [Ferrimicrobium sp.]|uniref:hypothetical protein n=1 Tax=Ferrimicrobium sp. TaxID=2926050 RepID=UPI00261955B3|nr:hypothetical protein [Ferrimicrobium sp.]
MSSIGTVPEDGGGLLVGDGATALDNDDIGNSDSLIRRHDGGSGVRIGRNGSTAERVLGAHLLQ